MRSLFEASCSAPHFLPSRVSHRSRILMPSPVCLPPRSRLSHRDALVGSLPAGGHPGGDHSKVKAFLDQGADVQARNGVEGHRTDAGGPQFGYGDDATPVATRSGCSARGVYDVTPFCERSMTPTRCNSAPLGSRVDERAMVIAAMVPGSRKVLELLSKSGRQRQCECRRIYRPHGRRF